MLELVTETCLDLAHSAVRHGDGLFETMRVEKGRILRLGRHLGRLAEGAAFFGLEGPPDAGIVRAFLEAHAGLDSLEAGVLRLYAVDGQLRFQAEAMDLAPLPPVKVALARSLVRFSGSPLNRFKTLSYLENTFLAREARHRGLFEVLPLNERGQLTDGSRTTLLLCMNQEILTPPVTSGALPGILRGVLLEDGVVREAELGLEDLRVADAVILCNSLRELIPVEPLAGSGTAFPPEALWRPLAEAVERSRQEGLA